jgi:hypothetical protein
MTCRRDPTDLTPEVVAGVAARDETSPSRRARLNRALAIISLAIVWACLHHPSKKKNLANCFCGIVLHNELFIR